MSICYHQGELFQNALSIVFLSKFYSHICHKLAKLIFFYAHISDVHAGTRVSQIPCRTHRISSLIFCASFLSEYSAQFLRNIFVDTNDIQTTERLH